jgi:hypothetical protein
MTTGLRSRRSPLTDSNRDLLLTMEDSTRGYVMWERRLLARFPCISAGLLVCSTFPLNPP